MTLETSPDQNTNLVDVLLKLRRWKSAVTVDISKAFLQIELADCDQEMSTGSSGGRIGKIA